MTDKNQIETQMAELEMVAASGEAVTAEAVTDLISNMKSFFGKYDVVEQGDGELFKEVGSLAQFITDAKKEIQQLNSEDLADKQLPEASDQLDAIIQMTESATSTIMDNCERVQSIQERLRDRLLSAEPPIDPDIMAGVDDAMTEGDGNIIAIFEACNFQDITGQRIQKIVKILRTVEGRLLKIILMFGLNHVSDEMKEKFQEAAAANAAASGDDDDDCANSGAPAMHGPSLGGDGCDGLDQDSIDDILNAIK